MFLVELGPAAQGRVGGTPLPSALSGPGALLSGHRAPVGCGLSCFQGSGHVNQAFILFFSPKVQLCLHPSQGF